MQHVEATAHHAVFAPQHTQRLCQLATGGDVGSIVFEVPASAAQIIASMDPTTFYLVLIKENWNLAALAPLTPEDVKSGALLPGEDPTKLTPYGPKGAPNPALTTTTTAVAPTTTKAN